MMSQRFGKAIHLTEHAKRRMIERDISIELLIDLIETGELSYKDDKHAWIAKYYLQRGDNLLCAAVIIEQAIIVKTVMFHFSFK
jgi:Domain of unknown function (DUF4258)